MPAKLHKACRVRALKKYGVKGESAGQGKALVIILWWQQATLVGRDSWSQIRAKAGVDDMPHKPANRTERRCIWGLAYDTGFLLLHTDTVAARFKSLCFWGSRKSDFKKIKSKKISNLRPGIC